MDIIMSIVYLFLGAFISLLVALLLQHRLETSFTKLFNRKFSSKPERNISGLWITQYKYPYIDENKKLIELTETQLVLFKQKNNCVFGKTIYSEEHPQYFEGKITMNRYFTGQYINDLNHHNYHGAFQFILASGKEKMEGKWIGFDDFNSINAGEWRWIQFSKSNKPKKETIHKAMIELKKINLFTD